MKSISLTIATILIIAMIFIIVGIYYGYNTLNKVIYAPNNSSSNLTSSSSTNTTSISSEYIPIVIYDISITIYNTQNILTPSPFQQDIAICNGNINIGSNFAYVNNATLFNQIDSDGQNVYFTTTYNSTPNIYSWYEGQLNYNGVTCDVWWIKLPNGILANSNITIYMLIGNYYTNYYPLYYPYVGVSPQVISGYDNGQDVFIAYGYFDNTFDGWNGHIYSGVSGPVASSNGIEMLSGWCNQGTYILPPNNWNIPKIPLIVEEVWYDEGLIVHYGKPSYSSSIFVNADSNVISLFGNTSQQIHIIDNLLTPTSNLSTFVQFDYYAGYTNLGSAITNITFGLLNIVLNITYFPKSGGTFYSYLIVNSSYAQAGYYNYSSNQIWAPLTLLDTYNVNYNNYTYYNLNYNPFQYGTLEISAGTGGYGPIPRVCETSYQYVEWVVARAYPPNGVMPSIYIG